MTKHYQNTYFLTATILEWKHLLLNVNYKKEILNTLEFLVKEKRVVIFGFVIMPNHIHLIWHINEGFNKNQTQGSLLRFTSQKIKYDLIESNPEYLEKFKVGAKDREYQIWERNPLAIEIYYDNVMEQKLNYIHNNPLQPKWKLAPNAEDYYFSSAKFYKTGIDDFGFLTSYFHC